MKNAHAVVPEGTEVWTSTPLPPGAEVEIVLEMGDGDGNVRRETRYARVADGHARAHPLAVLRIGKRVTWWRRLWRRALSLSRLHRRR